MACHVALVVSAIPIQAMHTAISFADDKAQKKYVLSLETGAMNPPGLVNDFRLLQIAIPSLLI